MSQWPKKCTACGEEYDIAAWEKQRYVGIQRSSVKGCSDLELRNCGRCSSTLSIAAPTVIMQRASDK